MKLKFMVFRAATVESVGSIETEVREPAVAVKKVPEVLLSRAVPSESKV